MAVDQKYSFRSRRISPTVLKFFLGILAVAAGILAVQNNSIIILIIAVVLIGVTVAAACLLEPLIGFYITTVAAFLAFHPGRFLDRAIPISTGIEVLVLLVYLGANWKKRGLKKENTLWHAPVSIAFLCYAIFFGIEFFNPQMDSVAGYILYARRFLMFILIYVSAYQLLDSRKKVKFFFEFWIVAAFITAFYGCFQQWFGLLPFEMRAILSDPHEYKLLLQGGMLRKFSILSDPVSFGILSGAMSLFTLILAIHEKGKRKRYVFGFMFLILFLGMMYSGTRTTIIILPCGIALYSLMTIENKRTLLVIFSFLVIGTMVLFAPIDSPALNRLRSGLNTKEASLDVRDMNRKYIQPYIHYHPIGGGIATSGVHGVEYNPNHPLAGFPPDSGLLKYAIETGWVGYLLIMLFYLVIIIQGISYYFQSRDPEARLYILALTATYFSIIVSEYGQVAVGQIPGVIFFYSGLAVLKRLLEFSKSNTK
jgi:putative inorganic carbon (HCO3(-)) transporter